MKSLVYRMTKQHATKDFESVQLSFKKICGIKLEVLWVYCDVSEFTLSWVALSHSLHIK
jgi:hypothetical protein